MAEDTDFQPAIGSANAATYSAAFALPRNFRLAYDPMDVIDDQSEKQRGDGAVAAADEYYRRKEIEFVGNIYTTTAAALLAKVDEMRLKCAGKGVKVYAVTALRYVEADFAGFQVEYLDDWRWAYQYARVRVSYRVYNPFQHGVTLRSTNIASAGTAIVNSGNRATYPICVITAAAAVDKNLTINNTQNSEQAVLLFSASNLATADYITIDMEERTVIKNTATDFSLYYTGNFIQLAGGATAKTSTINWTCNETSGTITLALKYRSRWL